MTKNRLKTLALILMSMLAVACGDAGANPGEGELDAVVDETGALEGEVEIVLNSRSHFVQIEGSLEDGLLSLDFDGVTLVTGNLRAIWDGNDAAIVREDADLDLTARGLVNGTCYNAGQVCNGVERIYVPHQLVEPLVEKILSVVRELRQGWQTSGWDYDLGPIIWEPQLDIYEAHTADAIEKGATLVCGGEARREGGGVYWPPTILTGMTHEMKMMREETFGPFLAIMGVGSDDEAVRLSNDSQYGLAGSVWTRDVKAGEAIARRLRTGSVMVNNALQSGGCVTLPFGGDGDSGVGRAQGEQAYYHYVATKSVMTSPDSAEALWMPYASTTEGFFKGVGMLFNGRGIAERASGLVSLIRNRPGG